MMASMGTKRKHVLAIECEASDAKHAKLINNELEKGHPDSKVLLKLMEADFLACIKFIKITTGIERIAGYLTTILY